jgi:hypothetical protein
VSNLSLVEAALADFIAAAPTLKGASASLGADAVTVAITVAEDLAAALKADLTARSLTPNEVKTNIDAATQAAIDAKG